MPKVRLKSNHDAIGEVNQFNIHGLSEVVGGIGDDYDSWFIKDLDVFLDFKQEWSDMSAAFDNKDLIPNNANTHFAIPLTPEDKDRGFYY